MGPQNIHPHSPPLKECLLARNGWGGGGVYNFALDLTADARVAVVVDAEEVVVAAEDADVSDEDVDVDCKVQVDPVDCKVQVVDQDVDSDALSC